MSALRVSLVQEPLAWHDPPANRERFSALLPPLAPWERRLVHLALSEDPELETESEGDGFLKRVEVRLKRA